MNSNIGFMTDYYFNMLNQTEIEHEIFEATVQGAFLENVSLTESADTVMMVNEGFKDVIHKIWEGIVKIWNNFLGILRKIKDFFLKGKLSKKANDLNKRCTNLINTIIKTGKEDTKISVAGVNNAETPIVIPPESIALSASDFGMDISEKGSSKIASIYLIFNTKLLAALSSAFKKFVKEMSYTQFKMMLAPIYTIQKAMYAHFKKKDNIDPRDAVNFLDEKYHDDINIVFDVGEKLLNDCTVDDLSNYGNFDNLVSDTDTKISKLNSEEFTKVIAKLYESISSSISKITRVAIDIVKDCVDIKELLAYHLSIFDEFELDLSSGNVIDNFMKAYTDGYKNMNIDDSEFVSFELAIDVVKEIQRKVISVGKNNKQLDVYISNMEKGISNMEDAFKTIMNNSNTAPEVASILKVLYDASMMDLFKAFTVDLFKNGLRLSGDLLDYYNKLIDHVEAVMGIAD